MTEKRQSAAAQQGPGTNSMPIGEFDGAATLPGDGPLFVYAALLALRDGPRRARSGARLRRRHPAVLQEPDQSARAYHLRQVGGRGGGIVRAHDAPLRPAGLAHRPHHGRRRARAGAYRDGVGAAVLPALAFRARLRACAAPAAAETADRRADVRPLRHACCAARSKPSCPITTSTSPTGATRAWCRWRTAASISTITSTTSSPCCTCSAATRMWSRCASLRCRCWRRSR